MGLSALAINALIKKNEAMERKSRIKYTERQGDSCAPILVAEDFQKLAHILSIYDYTHSEDVPVKASSNSHCSQLQY